MGKTCPDKVSGYLVRTTNFLNFALHRDVMAKTPKKESELTSCPLLLPWQGSTNSCFKR